MKIDRKTVEFLSSKYITLDEAAHLYFLVKDGNSPVELTASSRDKLNALGYIAHGELQDSSYELVATLAPNEEGVVDTANRIEQFEKFWEFYPMWDNDTEPTRKMKFAKDSARLAYMALLDAGHKSEDILYTLSQTIAFHTIIQGDLKFLKGIVKFLEQYLPWEGAPVPPRKQKGGGLA